MQLLTHPYRKILIVYSATTTYSAQQNKFNLLKRKVRGPLQINLFKCCHTVCNITATDDDCSVMDEEQTELDGVLYFVAILTGHFEDA